MGGYIGATAVGLTTTAADVQGDITSTDTTPEVILKNTTETDADGSRDGKITFKGEQSGGEESTLAQIQSSHNGTADDEKGDLIFKTNDGSDGSSPTEAMRIDSAQNVGIGCVPNSIQSGFDTLQIGGNLTLNVDGTGAGAGVYMGNNVYRDSGNSRWEYTYTDEASQYLQAGGEHIWRYAASGTADTAITWSEAMRIDSSGKVGIGTTTPLSTFQVRDTGANSGSLRVGGSGASLGLELSYDQAGATTSIIQANPTYTSTSQLLKIRADGDTNANQMVLLGSGQVMLGLAAQLGGGDQGIEMDGPTGAIIIGKASTNARTHISFVNPNGVVGSITTSGSATTFAGSSDYRLKENVTDISDGITRIKQLSPRRFNFIADADTTVDGFIAHEAQTVVPEAVIGTKDAMTEEMLYVDGDEIPEGKKVGDVKTAPTIDPQGIDQSKLVPLLTAALQEAIAKIETLETKVAALEG